MSDAEETTELAVEAYTEALLARAAELRLPGLFAESSREVVSRLRDRNGVSMVIVETDALSEEELEAVLRFRLAQYLAIGFADRRRLYEDGIEHEPLSSVLETDLHALAGTASDGELLCYMAVRGAPPTLHDERMGSQAREPFPVEEMHGLGVYDRLHELADIRVARVREMGRFVKNQRLHTFDELGVRAPIEVLLGLIRAFVGPLRAVVDALVGEIEEGVVKRNLDFFNLPTVMLRGTVSSESHPFLCGHDGRTFYPFAISIPDVAERSVSRADAIETALEQPGRRGILELLALKRSAAPTPSRFMPPAGLPPLTDAEVAHADLPMGVRTDLRRDGDLLRQVDPFGRLTPAEATVLRTFMDPRHVAEGEVIISQGADGDALFVVEEGEAEVLTTGGDGTPRSLGRLGPGSCFGEIAIVLGVVRTATVVARSPMTVLELSADSYRRYLGTIEDVDAGFVTSAVNRLARG